MSDVHLSRDVRAESDDNPFRLRNAAIDERACPDRYKRFFADLWLGKSFNSRDRVFYLVDGEADDLRLLLVRTRLCLCLLELSDQHAHFLLASHAITLLPLRWIQFESFSALGHAHCR
jgi:hypothetical protein